MACIVDCVEEWRLRYQAYRADRQAVLADKLIDQQRLHAQYEMNNLLSAFVQGTLSIRAFNTAFQQKTPGDWRAFSLGGISGGMFLNKLLKYDANEEILATQLRSCLPCPAQVHTGQQRIQDFMEYLEHLITEGRASRAQLQPGRVPFFLSAWWHIQNPQQWPIFFPLVFRTLATASSSEIPRRYQDPLGTYFTFRRQFLALAELLEASPWEVEHLLTWYSQHQDQESPLKYVRSSSALCALSKREPIADDEIYAVSLENETDEEGSARTMQLTSDHTRIQWLLAKIGIQVGCDVWIAANDHNKTWKGERLGDLSLKTLPLTLEPECRRTVSLVDVLWLQNDAIIAAYEIEHTTSITAGLLRLYDVAALCTTRNVFLCVILPHPALKRIQALLARPVFQHLTMHERCMVIQEEVLLLHAEHILRWASSPAIVLRLVHVSEQMEKQMTLSLS